MVVPNLRAVERPYPSEEMSPIANRSAWPQTSQWLDTHVGYR
jgi:hypothetical protein